MNTSDHQRKAPPALFTIPLPNPVTLTFAPYQGTDIHNPTGPKIQKQRTPLVIADLAGTVIDDGSTVSVRLNRGQIPLPLILWSATTTPPYASDPAGSGPGETWTTQSAQTRTEELILGDPKAALSTLFPNGHLA